MKDEEAKKLSKMRRANSLATRKVTATESKHGYKTKPVTLPKMPWDKENGVETGTSQVTDKDTANKRLARTRSPHINRRWDRGD